MSTWNLVDRILLFVSISVYEIDTDTPYMVCISASPGFPYMVSVFPCFPYMVSVFLCFPDMVMLPKNWNVKAIFLDRALLWAAMDYFDVTMIIIGRYCFIECAQTWAGASARRSMNYSLDLKVICCVFPWNNSIYILERICRLGRALGVFNKCSGFRPPDIL